MATRRTSRQTARRRKRPARTRTAQSLYRRPLRYEPLEDRRLLALVTVNTLSDSIDFNDGLTSLREAIFATNLVSGPDTIDFAPALTAAGPATILLTQGELKITDSLTINGPGAELLTIDASGNDPTPHLINGDGSRILNIDDATPNVIDISIFGLTLTGGQTLSDGGAIFTRESLTIADSSISDNFSRPSGSGGGGGVSAILRDGASFAISRSVVSNNQSYSRGGGIFLDVGTNSVVHISNTQIFGNVLLQRDSGLGGGILVINNLGSVTISDSKIHDNTSTGRGGGIFLSGNVTIERSSITDNSAVISGGGIQHGALGTVGTGTLTLVESEVLNNSAHDGGGIKLSTSTSIPHSITRSIIAGNMADGRLFFPLSNGGVGGGIFAEQGSLHIVDSTIVDNTARKSGGGLYTNTIFSFTANVLIEGSTVSHNSAETGGGLTLNRGGVIRQSTISGNSATVGAGIHTSFSTTIDQSTLSENVATSMGGAVFLARGALRLDHSILAKNSSLATGGDLALASVATVSAFHSLIGHNSGSGLLEAPIGSPDTDGNLIGGPTHGAIDPLLRPLADYGGPLLTYGLSPDSPAVNAGDPNAQAGVNGVPLYDQRGEPFGRVVGGRIDIGAFEFQGPIDFDLLVDTLVDESDGNYTRGDLSLREAIQLANLFPSTDTIYFDPALTAAGPATILLTYGELRIVDDVTIDGPGASLLTIDASGNDPTPDINDINGSGIFIIDDGTDNLIDVLLSGLTLTGGDSEYGGAVLSAEKLTIATSTISGNHASELGGGVVGLYGGLNVSNCIVKDNETAEIGGGIAAFYAELVVVNSTISGNIAHVGGGIHAFGSDLSIVDSNVAENSALGFGAAGGGVFHQVGRLTVSGSTISGNVANSGGGIYSGDDAKIVRSRITGNSAGGHGGGIYTFGRLEVRLSTISDNYSELDGGGIRARGDVTIDSSTLARNVAGRAGGGVWLELDDVAATIINATITGNQSALHGGGVFVDGLVTDPNSIEHTTIANNTAGANGSITGKGGGVYVANGQLLFDHTIVAGNHDHSAAPDITGSHSGGYNLIGVGAEFLGPLVDNGGPTMTHALLPGSPAINAGDLNAKAGVGGVPLYDQRGEPFGRVFGGRIDIGAFEYQEPSDLNLLVDTLVDESDGNYSRGDLSLREATELANLWPSTDTIHFDPTLTAAGPAKILLTKGELKITDSLTITGPGADLLTIDASGNDPTPHVRNRDGTRVFNIHDGNFGSRSDVTLVGLELTGGDVSGGGGAIATFENLSLVDSTISGNSAALVLQR